MWNVSDLSLTPGKTQRVVLLLLLTFFLLLSISSSAQVTVTLDEPLHYHYGLFILEGQSNRIDDSSMPVSALNALPNYVSRFLRDGTLKVVLERYSVARLVTILFSAAIAALVFHWSRALYGFVAAVFSTMLYVLDPNVIAHSQLVTTDVFAAGMTTATFYLLWKFAKNRRTMDGILCAVVLGLSQLVKYTAVALFPLALLALLMHDVPLICADYSASGARTLGRYIRRYTLYTILALLISTLVINAGFLFNRTFTPLNGYQFRSDAFRVLLDRFPALGELPVPVPYPYMQGLDLMQHTNQSGDRFGNIYLLGQVSEHTGFPGYYFVAAALKVPIATLVFVLAALAFYAVFPLRRVRFLQDEVFFLVPFAAFTLYFNFLFNAQIGIRYYLVVFPLLYVFVGHLFAEWRTVPNWAKTSSLVLVVYLAVSVLTYFPHYIPYFNELVWDKTQTYKYLSDSNLDWGQSQWDLQRFLAEHPEAVYDPPSVQPGLLVVGGSDLVGILTEPAQYAWLRDNFKPVDTIAYAYFVYRVSPEEISNLCSSTAYCQQK